ncbi:hypothetical protein ACLOJK_005729 [Asimina triloba]
MAPTCRDGHSGHDSSIASTEPTQADGPASDQTAPPAIRRLPSSSSIFIHGPRRSSVRDQDHHKTEYAQIRSGKSLSPRQLIIASSRLKPCFIETRHTSCPTQSDRIRD